MFTNAVIITETDPEKIFYIINYSIKECASNHEEYVTFRLDGGNEIIVKAIEKALKDIGYSTFSFFHVFDEENTEREEHWYLKVSWRISVRRERYFS